MRKKHCIRYSPDHNIFGPHSSFPVSVMIIWHFSRLEPFVSKKETDHSFIGRFYRYDLTKGDIWLSLRITFTFESDFLKYDRTSNKYILPQPYIDRSKVLSVLIRLLLIRSAKARHWQSPPHHFETETGPNGGPKNWTIMSQSQAGEPSTSLGSLSRSLIVSFPFWAFLSWSSLRRHYERSLAWFPSERNCPSKDDEVAWNTLAAICVQR